MQLEQTKTCSKCGRTLPLSHFTKAATTRDGLKSACRDCIKQYSRAYNLKKKADILALDTRRDAPPADVKMDTTLSKYTPRDLMDELKRRGYRMENGARMVYTKSVIF